MATQHAFDYERECADFEWDIPDGYNLPEAVASHASDGDRLAVRFRDDTGTATERTYAALRGDMNRFADALADLGIQAGDRVMHLFPRHPEAFAIQLGVLARGALVVPCSSMLKPKDVEFRANDCGATAVVCHASLTDMVEPVLEETPLETKVVLDGDADGWERYGDLIASRDGHHDGPDLHADDPMSINYTSGTTGRPKPVLHRHRWMRCFEQINARYWWGVTRETDFADELLWATTGTGWAKWFWSPVGVGLTTGAPQFIYDGEFEPDRFLELMEAEGVTRLCAVPTQYRMFMQEDLEAYDLELTDALSAGEPLNREPIEAFESALDVTPRGAYGQTETVAIVGNYPGIRVKPGSMGRPLPGTGATIIDTEEETEVDVGEPGEIAIPIDSPAGFDGYYEKPEIDEETFDGEYYRTGDLAHRDEEGYYFFEGRTDDIILSAGYRIGPFEVEDALVGHEAVAEAAAVASPHEERGNVVKAFLVTSEGHEASDDLVTALQEHVKEATAPYKYPRRIEFVDALPKTSSGKIRRVELREREKQARTQD